MLTDLLQQIRVLAELDVGKYSVILEVVREKCIHARGGTIWGEVKYPRCYDCKATGYRPRNWKGFPEWWLATLLVEAAYRSGLEPLQQNDRPWMRSDSTVAAQAVIKALEVQRETAVPGQESG